MRCKDKNLDRSNKERIFFAWPQILNPSRTINSKSIRTHIRTLICHQFNLMDRSATYQTHIVLNEIWSVVEMEIPPDDSND